MHVKEYLGYNKFYLVNPKMLTFLFFISFLFMLTAEGTLIMNQNPLTPGNYYESLYRNFIMESNRQKILKSNQQTISFKLQANKFIQYTQSEFQSMLLVTRVSNNLQIQVISPYKVETKTNINLLTNTNYNSLQFNSINIYATDEMDINWTRSGMVTGVKNQGGCGSCWAFSAVSDLQSSYLLNGYRGNIDLSEQQLVDCSNGFYNFGCAGGWMTNAFAYIYKNPLTTQTAYPYLATSNTCKNVTGSFTLKNIRSYWQNRNCQLLVDILQTRPLAVAVAADFLYWGFYKSGVLNQCPGTINHGVVLTGVKKSTTQNYWIVKNSWGADWGQNGYIRIDRTQNNGNLCDICSYPQYSML